MGPASVTPSAMIVRTVCATRGERRSSSKERHAQRHRPHVVLTADVTALARLRTWAAGGVIVLAVESTDERLHRALTDGARGFLLERTGHEELVSVALCRGTGPRAPLR
ncbi:hypothetical protein LFM09_49750 [Lentzea alba]|uniref:hypothetical protein n=1 Tax=Lentzea alba TaxID=2714351 RepID=UPI0039BEEB73